SAAQPSAGAATRQTTDASAASQRRVECMRRSPGAVSLRTGPSGCEKYHSKRSEVNRSARDHATPDDVVAAVPDDGLSGRDRPLRRVERDLGPAVFERADGGRRRRVVVADLRLDADRLGGRLARDEVHVGGDETGPVERPDVSDRYRVRPRIEIEDVQRPAGGQAQALALADRIGREPGVGT